MMMAEALISVAMCTYNGAKYLKEQLDSIINQTHQNLEIIIVDDCSTDDTYTILTQYADADKRIKCYRNDTNLGYNKNFERAIGLTTGQYISISDQDDIWNLNKLETLLNAIGDKWLVFSNSEWMAEDGSNKNQTLLNNFSVEGKNYKMLLITNYMAGHSALFNREFLSHLLPFPRLGFYDWWMAFVALYNNQIVYVDQPLTRYRKHEQSVIQNILVKDKERLKYNLLKVNVDQYTAFESYPKLKSEDKAFINQLKRAFELRLLRAYSMPLVQIIYKNYEELYTESKPRTGLSRLNFAFKNAKRIRRF